MSADPRASERADRGIASPALSIPQLLERCMGSAHVAALVLDKFEEQLKKDVAQIERQLAEEDAEELARTAHALEGAAGAVSASALQTLAAELEVLARKGRLGAAAHGLASVRAEVDRCLRLDPNGAVRARDTIGERPVDVMRDSLDRHHAHGAIAPLFAGRAARILIGGGIVLWLACAIGGLGYLADYAATPGPALPAMSSWPATSSIPREPDSATIVLFLHPHCPCSSATISELERALTRSATPVHLCVVFSRPASVDAEWGRTALRRRVEALPPSLVLDDAGREAHLFGAVTSGHTAFYDANGSLLFEGGMTASRGHEGANDGGRSLALLLAGRAPLVRSTPVYGCLLSARVDETSAATNCCEADT